jgi:glycosyltransferase involved in cell wall biosynthesis
MPKNKIKISFCAIVKDNLANVKRMIESLGSVCDEIVIVDTGSSDKVVRYEKTVADKFFIQDWQNDFAKIRNFAIDKSSSEWIFSLDSDEEASRELVKKLPRLVEKENVDGYKLPRVHYAGEKNPMKDYWRQLRLYRREARFSGTVHESIKNLNNIVSINDFCYCINHYNDRLHQREKSLKYSRYLKEKISEAQKNNDRPMVEYYCYKLWVQDNVYLLETDPKVSQDKLQQCYVAYEKLKQRIERKMKQEHWVVK